MTDGSIWDWTVRPLVLAAAAWLLLRLFRIRHPASQHAVWTGLAAGMLLLPILTNFAPHWKLPVLPAQHALVAHAPAPVSAPVFPMVFQPGIVTAPVRKTPSLNSLLLWIYLAGLLTRLVYRVIGWAMLHRLVATSLPVHGRVRESGAVIAPVTAGILQPVVVLPAGWREWDWITRRAVLAHEFAHIRRGDEWSALLARWITCAFWYHPLAWLVARKLSETAESACDAAALRGLPDPAAYSRILLAFAEDVRLAGFRVNLPGLAMAAPSAIGKRIDQVFELSSGNVRRLRRPGAFVAVLGTPLLCLAATTGLGERVLSLPLPPALRLPAAPPLAPQIGVQRAQEVPLKSLSDTLAGQIPSPPGLYLDQDLEEYHRRQAYGNDHFSYGRMRGAVSARGQAYVWFGLADSIEDHSATADTPAYQLWCYRQIDDLGDNIALEFVDAAGTGEYREAVGPGMPGAYAIPGDLGLTTIHVSLAPGVGRLHLTGTISSTPQGAAISTFEDDVPGGPFSKITALAPGSYTLALELTDEATGVASKGQQSFQVR